MGKRSKVEKKVENSKEEGKKNESTIIPPSFDSELDALFSAASTSKPVEISSILPQTNEPQEQEDNDESGFASERSEDDDNDEQEATENVQETVVDGEEEEDENDSLNPSSDEDEDEENESDSGSTRLVHETLLNKNDSKQKAKKRKVDDDEPQEIRDRRSIFVGNLPLSLIKSRSGIKALKKHLIEQCPYPSAVHIQSIRLRSIPFSKPTDDYDARNQQDADNKMRKRQRSRAFKESLNESSGESKHTTFLTGSQKRKVAFITQQINEKADSINAYVTLSPLSEKRLAKLKETNEENVMRNLSADVLAALLARSAHGTTFEGRHLRVDMVTPLQPSELIESGLDTVKTADGSMLGATAGGSGVDQEGRRRTAFVGNMDFETGEEEVRTFFNALMIDERGQAPQIPKLDFNNCTKLPKPEKDFNDLQTLFQQSWVQDVRIIRDAATQMGKGFAYVKFLDAACVDELIAMHESEEAFLAAAKAGKSSTPLGQFRRKLKLKGRPLRVSKCKVPKGHVIPKGRKNESNGAGMRTPRPTNKNSMPNGGHRSRSTGAPTPGGTSPFAKRQKTTHNRTIVDSPTAKRSKTVVDKENVSNPIPKYKDPLKAAQIAQKKADPERQAKRMAKKNAKRASMKMQAIASELGTSGKVSLKPSAKANNFKKSSTTTNKRKAGHSAKVRKT